MQLYDYEFSADCYKVRLMLSALGLAHELVPVDIHPGRDHLAPAFLALNPGGEVPVLVAGEVVLRSAPAILVWLARGHGPGWMPEAPEGQAECAHWLALSQRLADTVGAVRMARATGVFDPPAPETAIPLLRQLEAHLWAGEQAGRDWLLPGSAPGIADIACFPDSALAEEAGIDLIDYPAIRRWHDRLRRIEGFVPMSGIFPGSPARR